MNFKLLLFSVFALVLISFSTPKPSLKTATKVLNRFCNYVPSGNTVLNGDTTSVRAFYMSATEITNLQYAEFLYYLKINNEVEKLEIAAIDTSCWTSGVYKSTALAKYYGTHPAYHDYPVVGISYEAAELYCEYLTMQYRNLSNGELKIKFRIPTQEEWLRAVRGNNYHQLYAWEIPTLRNEDGKMQANCIAIGAENITFNNETQRLEVTTKGISYDPYMGKGDVLAPARSYWPNEFGFYNMNGNVAELLAGGKKAAGGAWNSPGFDIRNESLIDYNGPKAFIGFRVVASIMSSNTDN